MSELIELYKANILSKRPTAFSQTDHAAVIREAADNIQKILKEDFTKGTDYWLYSDEAMILGTIPRIYASDLIKELLKREPVLVFTTEYYSQGYNKIRLHKPNIK